MKYRNILLFNGLWFANKLWKVKDFTHKISRNAGVGIAYVEWIGLVVVVKVALARLPLTRHPLDQPRKPRNWNMKHILI
jgi:hypothetical protein